MSKLRHGYATLDRDFGAVWGAVTMLRHGVRVTISSLALCVASSAGAQGNLDQSKTAAQLYASNCATCHESLASIRNTKSFFELKSFLSQHYTSNSEAAANLAAYLKGPEKLSVESQRRRGAMSEVRSPEPTPSASEEDTPRPPADIPEVPPSAIATSLSHEVDTGVKPHRRASSAKPLPRLRPAELAPPPAASNKPASVQIND
jgi:cytochrome c553